MKLKQITKQDTRYRVLALPSVTRGLIASALPGNSIEMLVFRHCPGAPKRMFTLAIFPGDFSTPECCSEEESFT